MQIKGCWWWFRFPELRLLHALSWHIDSDISLIRQPFLYKWFCIFSSKCLFLREKKKYRIYWIRRFLSRLIVVVIYL